jgi:hypothetical protein
MCEKEPVSKGKKFSAEDLGRLNSAGKHAD